MTVILRLYPGSPTPTTTPCLTVSTKMSEFNKYLSHSLLQPIRPIQLPSLFSNSYQRATTPRNGFVGLSNVKKCFFMCFHFRNRKEIFSGIRKASFPNEVLSERGWLRLKTQLHFHFRLHFGLLYNIIIFNRHLKYNNSSLNNLRMKTYLIRVLPPSTRIGPKNSTTGIV